MMDYNLRTAFISVHGQMFPNNLFMFYYNPW